MNECAKQVSQRRLGWISTGVLVLFAFLIALPFAGQSVALTAPANVEMATVNAPQGNMTLPSLTKSKSHDHHKLSKSRTAAVSLMSKMCVSMGHVTHRTHICCFEGTLVEGTISRRDLDAIEKLVFARSMSVPFGTAINAEQQVLAIEFKNAPSKASQLAGLIGAGAQFVRTQRLLT